MVSVLLLLLGFVLLIKGADFFVDSASQIAKRLRVPSVIIGLTVVAFGTSAPELAVSASAAIAGNSDIALGNVVGSNLFNLLIVVGLSAVIKPMKVESGIIKRDFPFSIVAAAVLLLLSIGTFANADGVIGVTDGLVLLLLFGIFLYALIREALTSRRATVSETEIPQLVRRSYCRPMHFKKPSFGAEQKPPVTFSLFMLVIGLAAIVIGGNLVVDSATNLAKMMGVSDSLIALTIVAFGTSLPELVTSLVAAKKGEEGIAIGNVVGSNVFNLLLIVGTASAISPINVPFNSVIDLVVLIAVSIACFIPIVVRKKVDRVTGALMLVTYAAYIAYIIIR